MQRSEQTTKDTNPKDAIGSKKWPLSFIPAIVAAEVGAGMLEGGCKYSAFNYREAGVRFTVYYDACRRHLDKFIEGEDIDPDSGLSHITKAICSLMVLRDSMIRGNWVDDRPPKIDPAEWDRVQKIVDELLARYPDPKPRVTHIGLQAKEKAAQEAAEVAENESEN